MAMPVAARTDWTVEVLDALPDDGQRYEIIDGELFVTPAPADVHQLVLGELHARVHAYLRGSSVGKVIFSPADVRRGDRTRNRVQPDLFVVRLTEGRRPALTVLSLSLSVPPSVPTPDIGRGKSGKVEETSPLPVPLSVGGVETNNPLRLQGVEGDRGHPKTNRSGEEGIRTLGAELPARRFSQAACRR